MLFRRRNAPTKMEVVRLAVWPRRSWERSLKYVMARLLRINASPHQLALGCAVGVFAAITPFVGVQMLLAGAMAIALRASLAAAMLGSFFGNPVTWALLWPATYATGTYMLGEPGGQATVDLADKLSILSEAVGSLSLDMLGAAWGVLWPFIKPMALGTLPVGLVVAGLFYYATKHAAVSYRLRRRRSSRYYSPYPLGDFVATYDPAHS
ncbi:MAG: DUF2062 domain-containing protein [Hyphomicrobiaceae bacterium]|nr:DUF2062 domain-containing protein [Hyphomicrobiaceae bacterium]